MVLLMTVNPGFGGQKYIESCTAKIRDLRKMMEERGLEIDIEVDGGIKLNNVQTVLDAAPTSSWRAPRYSAAISRKT